MVHTPAAHPPVQTDRAARVPSSPVEALEKLRINAAGYCKAGPIRPRYEVIPAEYAEASRECGRRWAQLAERYAAVAATRSA